MAIAVCSLGATASANDFMVFSPPDLLAIIDNAATVVSMAVVAAIPVELNVKLKDYFTRYANSDEVFVANGTLFHKAGDAQSFGGEVNKYTREQVIQAKTVNSNIAEIDLSTLSYDELKKLIKELKLMPADNKAETYLATLQEHQETLKQS